jgi:hypothetical protein
VVIGLDDEMQVLAHDGKLHQPQAIQASGSGKAVANGRERG